LVGSFDAFFEQDYEIVLEMLEVTMAEPRIALTFALRIVSRFFSSGAAFLGAAAIFVPTVGALAQQIQSPTPRFSVQPVYASQEPRTGSKLAGFSFSNRVR